MPHSFTFLLVLCVLSQRQVLAAEPQEGTSAVSVSRDTSSPSQKAMLSTAIEREAARLALSLGKIAVPPSQQPVSQDRGWIRRHPVLFGAIVGAGVGAVSSVPRWNELYCATGGDEDCVFHGGVGVLVGAGAGAGVGALIGSLFGRGE